MKQRTKNLILTICAIAFISSFALPAFAANEVTNLTASTKTQTTITWQWTADATQYNSTVYIDGVWTTNVTSPITGTQSYQATGLTRATSYTIGIRTANNTYYNETTTYSGWTNATNTTDALFTGISDVIDATVNLMPSIVNLVVGIVPVLVTLAVVGLITGIFSAIVLAIKGGL